MRQFAIAVIDEMFECAIRATQFSLGKLQLAKVRFWAAHERALEADKRRCRFYAETQNRQCDFSAMESRMPRMNNELLKLSRICFVEDSTRFLESSSNPSAFSASDLDEMSDDKLIRYFGEDEDGSAA